MTGGPTASLIIGLLALAACSTTPPQSQADREARAACGERADTVVEKQNRGYFLTPNTQGGTPYSSTGVPFNPTPALVRQKQRDDLMNQCLNGSAANTGAVATPTH